MLTRAYRNAVRALLTAAERRTFARLNTPQKIQIFIERLSPNFELKGETYMSPRRALKARRKAGFSATVSSRALIIREPIDASFAQEGTSPQTSGASRRRTSPESLTRRSKMAGTATVGATL